MTYFTLEYAKSGRSNCRRCGESIPKDSLRTAEAVENSDGFFSTHYRHWGCSTPAIIAALGVNTPGFHGLDEDDQKRVTEAIKNRKLSEADITELMKPAPTLPTGLAMSPSAAVTVTAKPKAKSSIWAPPRPGSKKRKEGPVAGPSGTSGISAASGSAAASGSDRSSAIPSSSQASTGAGTLQGSSSQHAIDLTSSPEKPKIKIKSEEDSDEPAQPGEVAEGRLIRQEREEQQEEKEEEAAEPEEDVFYVRTQGEVVGIQHYPGLVGVGERVVLRRQPHNQYDANAIQVLNMYNQQVGHVPRGTASRLAALMDKRYISVEGTMITGNLGYPGRYKLSLLLDIYGPPSNRDALAPHLAWAGPVSLDGVAPPPYEPQTGVNGSRSPKKGKGKAVDETDDERRARELLQELEGLDKGDARRDGVMDQLTKTIDVLKLPMHPNPPSRASRSLLNDLLPHQSQALLWMQQHENPSLAAAGSEEHVQLWQRKEGNVPHWLNIATRSPQPLSATPILGRGGILADAMGLGKTLTILALVIASKAETSPGFCGATLIVCPLSVLSNWENQVSEHTPAGKIKLVVFHGDGKAEKQASLEGADIVLTTYNVLSAELNGGNGGPAAKKRGKGKAARLLDINWKRVVLDEGHTIRNPKAAMSRACTALSAHRRWVVSGTPIVNGAKDLGSLLSFLRICKPLDEPEQFKRLIVRNLNAGGNGAALLQAIMTQSCLRRTKEMEDENGNRLVSLPPVNFYVVKVDLHASDRAAYDVAMNHSKRRFQEYIDNNRSGSLPPNVLQLLTRLRQLALYSALVPEGYIEDLQKEEQKHVEVEQLTEETKRALVWKLKAAIDDAEECPICFDALAQPRITMCGHSYCLDCITEVIRVQAKCPMDRTNLPSLAHVLELPEVMPPKDGEGVLDWDDSDDADEPVEKIDVLRSSAKIDELVKYLKAFPKGQKSLVFSQFCKFLDAIEPHLARAGIRAVRFDGSMSASARAKVLNDFQKSIKGASKFSKPIAELFNGAATAAVDGQGKGKARAKVEDDSSATEVSDEEEEEVKPVKTNAKPVKKRLSRKAKGKRRARVDSDSDFEDRGASESEDEEDTKSDTRPTVMLISLKSGSVGINLTAAQNVFLMDPWWSSAIEMQAIDRVNRIGQTASEVRVFQMIAKDTIEDKVLAIQAQKNELIQQAFAGNKIKETARQKKEARFAEMRELFGVDGPNESQGEAGGSRLRQTTL